MYPLFACSVVAVAIILERSYQFTRIAKRKENFLLNLENETITDDNLQERGAQRIIFDMEKNLSFLSIIANLSVLLGLLGTVLGLITAFIAVENYGQKINPSILANGIWQALITTAYGLIIAILSSAFYYLFEYKISMFEKQYAIKISQVKSKKLEKEGEK